MIGRLLTTVLLVAVAAQFAWGSGDSGWTTIVRETRILAHKIKATIQRKANDIKGVVYIYPPFGKRNTYHFTGKIDGRRVTASHTSGHVFHGRIEGKKRVVGELRTKKGYRIPIKIPLN